MITTGDVVSIVIPSFNHGRYLGQAIESALGQKYRPIEIVVVNDGSTDETPEVARRYPVKLISQPNAGLAAASNVGIRASTGTFVMRLDADDWLAPTYVDDTVRALQVHSQAHFAYTEVDYFGAVGGTYPVAEFDPETLAERNYVHASAMMRRASFDAVGGYAPNPDHLRCEDWDLWLSFAERGMHGVLVRKRLLHYRRHEAGSMASFDLVSVKGLRREIQMARHLQKNHPRLFASPALLRRMRRLPRRLLAGDISIRLSMLLVAFYGVMLANSLGRTVSGRRCTS